MIKVLQVGFSTNYGGVEACIMNYYREIDKNKVQFGFLNIYNSDIACKDEIISLGGQIHRVQYWNKNPIKGKKELIKIINENNYDIVHFNMNGIANSLQFFSAESSNAIWIVHSHTAGSSSIKIKKIAEFFNRIYIKNKTKILLACSDKASQYMFHCSPNNSNCFIIRNAINVEKYNYNKDIRNKIRNKYNIKDDTLVFGTVGRIEKQKNHEFLIDIFKEITNIHSNSKLMIVGEGSLRKNIEKKIETYDLKDKVVLLGACSNTNEMYQAMDAFVLPSLYEGLPLVGVEAQAAGLPMILSDSITKEIDLSNSNKYLSLSLSAKKWAEQCIKYAMLDRNQNFNKELINNGFDILNEVNKLLNIYEKLVIDRK